MAHENFLAHQTRRLVVAPMMGRTDAAGCAYLRQVLPQALLFTEMIPAGALACDAVRAHRRLQEYFDWLERLSSSAGHTREEAKNEAKSEAKSEGGLVLQLGGGDPAMLRRACIVARAYPFCEWNLNLGCPSPRTTKGFFGACLMKQPCVAASCVAALKEEARDLPVSVKTRIGVDDQDDEESLHAFLDALCAAGCEVVYLHARKAWLKGVSPKDNRTLPPLRPQVVRRLKEARPSLTVIYNGGIGDFDAAEALQKSFAGVMVGRALWRSPCAFADEDSRARPSWRTTLSEHLLSAIEKASRSSRLSRRGAARLCMRAMSLWHGEPHANCWRRKLLDTFENLKAGEAIR